MASTRKSRFLVGEGILVVFCSRREQQIIAGRQTRGTTTAGLVGAASVDRKMREVIDGRRRFSEGPAATNKFVDCLSSGAYRYSNTRTVDGRGTCSTETIAWIHAFDRTRALRPRITVRTVW